jgi:hypothetical protein
MPSYDQLPGRLNVAFRASDDFSALIDFSVALTGFSMSAPITSAVTGDEVAEFVVTVTDAAAGKVNIGLTDSQTASLTPGTYRWQLVGTAGALTRTYLEGFVEVKA